MLGNKTLMALTFVFLVSAMAADDEAAMTAEVYAIAKGAKNEDVLKHISNPDHYDAMAKARGEDSAPAQENLRIQEVTVKHIDETHAVARAQYAEKHSGRSGEEEIHLELKEGKWQVISPPAPPSLEEYSRFAHLPVARLRDMLTPCWVRSPFERHSAARVGRDNANSAGTRLRATMGDLGERIKRTDRTRPRVCENGAKLYLAPKRKIPN